MIIDSYMYFHLLWYCCFHCIQFQVAGIMSPQTKIFDNRIDAVYHLELLWN